jgi:hypothetical protein
VGESGGGGFHGEQEVMLLSGVQSHWELLLMERVSDGNISADDEDRQTYMCSYRERRKYAFQ